MTTKTQRLSKKIEGNKELQTSINKVSHYSNEQFIKDALQYIKATKDGRMICIIKSVSSSGMSRVLKFNSCEAGKNGYYQKNWYSNYFAFFLALGYNRTKDGDGFRIGGCGMDMIFHTNYSIMHKLCRVGFINKAECDKLSQKTPPVL